MIDAGMCTPAEAYSRYDASTTEPRSGVASTGIEDSDRDQIDR